ncbi:MAG: aldo/keto reductase [Acidobacteriota bacterium]
MDGRSPTKAGHGALGAAPGCLTHVSLREHSSVLSADAVASIPGRATVAATADYARRLQHIAHSEHFRDTHCPKVSSIGIGTFMGPATSDADASYSSAIVRATELGCNLIDTAINYRHQRAERCVGAALRTVCADTNRRNELVVSTKAGYLPFDGELPQDADRYLYEQYEERLQLAPGEVVEKHCIAPAFLRDQVARSRVNLGLETIDVFYLHNPEEQLRFVDRASFESRLRAAMATLEESCQQGHIASYGLATWVAFRESKDHPQYLSLDEVVRWAVEVGGPRHHFRFLQLPLNLKALEPYMLANQWYDGRWCTLLEVAQAHGIHIVTSAPLLQGRILGRLPPPIQRAFAALSSDVQRTVQFVRSIPGVGSVLVGMGRSQHVEENLALASLAPDTAAIQQIFRHT